MQLSQRPWLSLYQAVPATIDMAAPTGLDMFRATLGHGRDAPLVHYFDRSVTSGEIDTISDATDLLVDQQDVTPLGLAYQAIELQTSEDALDVALRRVLRAMKV